MEQEIIDVVVPIEIPIEILVDSMRKCLSKDDLLEFIKEIDLSVAEYDFTAKLRDYFVLEMAKEDKHLVNDLELGCERKK
jgi:hypothetical protein